MEKKYTEKLANGTVLDVKISVDIENFNEKDYNSVFSSFASCSHDFYLKELKSIINTD